MAKELYNLGEMPPLGEIPEKMHAWLIRPERFGIPMEAFQKEVVNVPPIADDEVLVGSISPFRKAKASRSH